MTEQSGGSKTPDQLMDRFQGNGIKRMIIFTLIVHVVVLTVSSVPYIIKKALHANTSKMTQEEKVDAAVKAATASIREIADDYGLNPSELSERFGAPRPAAAPLPTAEAEPPEAAEDVAVNEPDKPKSEIEKAIEVKADGPEIPSIDDIFD